jgi:hypothetical protein
MRSSLAPLTVPRPNLLFEEPADFTYSRESNDATDVGLEVTQPFIFQLESTSMTWALTHVQYEPLTEYAHHS